MMLHCIVHNHCHDWKYNVLCCSSFDRLLLPRKGGQRSLKGLQSSSDMDVIIHRMSMKYIHIYIYIYVCVILCMMMYGIFCEYHNHAHGIKKSTSTIVLHDMLVDA